MPEIGKMRIRSMREETFASILTISVTPDQAAPLRRPFKQSRLGPAPKRLGHPRRENMAVQQQSERSYAALHLSGELLQIELLPAAGAFRQKIPVSSHVAEIVPCKFFGLPPVEFWAREFFSRALL
jgi:hypothetical protein